MSDKEREAMKKRCEDQGHEWENCCSAWFEIYQQCKWCGEKKIQTVSTGCNP